jgi:hypothetical protein
MMTATGFGTPDSISNINVAPWLVPLTWSVAPRLMTQAQSAAPSTNRVLINKGRLMAKCRFCGHCGG